MHNASIVQIFRSSWLYGGLFFLVFQQLLAASSTLWLVNFADDIRTGGNFQWNAVLYFASLVLPYLPGGLYNVSLIHWELDALANYVKRFVAGNHGRVEFYSESEIRVPRSRFHAFASQTPGTVYFQKPFRLESPSSFFCQAWESRYMACFPTQTTLPI